MSRFIRSVSTLALVGLLASCATSSGAGGQAGDSVNLRFAWPQGFTAQVSSTSSESEGGQPPERKERRYQMRLEGAGEERKLITDSVPGAAAAIPKEGPPLPTPTLVLGPAGELKRVEGIDQALTEMFKDAESQGISPEQRNRLAKLVGEALEQSARDRWEELMGKWNGLTLKPGQVVERKSRMTLPFFGNSVDIQERLSLKEHVPCTEGSTEKRCVRLVLDASLDPEGNERAGVELVQRMRAFMVANTGLPESTIPEMKVTKLQIDSALEFIVEPETLIPHQLRDVDTSIILVQGADGETQNFNVRSERVELFTPGAR